MSAARSTTLVPVVGTFSAGLECSLLFGRVARRRPCCTSLYSPPQYLASTATYLLPTRALGAHHPVGGPTSRLILHGQSAARPRAVLKTAVCWRARPWARLRAA